MTLGDRIVMMRDGFIQQIGTPQEVFHHPSNLFVAGFTWNAADELFPGRRTEAGKWSIHRDYSGKAVFLSSHQQEALKASGRGAGMVMAGVRPQHIHLEHGGIPAEVEASERMGREQHLHLNAGGSELVAIVPTSGSGNQIETMEIDFVSDCIHLFDPESERNLI